MTAQRTYQGRIKIRDHGDAMDILFVETQPAPDYGDDPFAEILEDDLNMLGRFITVRYHISEERRTLEELEENAVKVMSGAADARYKDHHSDVTGYLWTDEELNVGGHDLLAELGSNDGQYLYMIVDFYDTSSLGGLPQISGV
jgi:hypothetical protein